MSKPPATGDSAASGPAKAAKAPLRDELLTLLRQQLADATAAYQATIEGAFHDDAKAEGDKDMRGTELSYLARGQAQRVEELEVAIAHVTRMVLRDFGEGDPISASAVVDVAYAKGGTKRYFIAPSGGGLVLSRGDAAHAPHGLIVVTPSSPLGALLCGKRQGDDTTDDERAAHYGEIVAVA